MSSELKFDAPWSTTLKVTTGISVAICLGVAAIGAYNWGKMPMAASVAMMLVSLVVLLTWPFAIRGFTVLPGVVLVHRPLWDTRVELSGMSAVKADPNAIKGSIRLFGDGGLFCFCGLFRNKELGNFDCYATDFSRSVVLMLPKGPVVVTPGDVAGFVEAVEKSSAE